VVGQNTKYKTGDFLDFVFCILSRLVCCDVTKTKSSCFQICVIIVCCGIAGTKYKLRSPLHKLDNYTYHESSMKRSAALSLTKPAATKKHKPVNVVSSLARVVQATKTKASVTPKLSRSQLKGFHYLLSTASYITVLEGTQMGVKKIRERCYDHYHGYDADHPGVVKMFLEGQGRFRVIWNAGRIVNGFGTFSGIAIETLEKAISRPTLKGTTLITGRQLLDKAKEALSEAKKLLGFWMEFMNNGSLPSGMNEEYALQYVLFRAFQESSSERGDRGDDDDSVEEIETNVTNAQFNDNFDETLFDGLGDVENVGDGDSDSGSDREEAPAVIGPVAGLKEKKRYDVPHNFLPPAMLPFILYGPYGVGVYNLEISAVLNMDTKGIEESSLSKTMNAESLKESKAKDSNAQR
jgi:hypothetical protein